MDIGLILLTLVCFAGGIFLSRWQARKHYREMMARRMTHEVEKELARRAVERFSQKGETEVLAKPSKRPADKIGDAPV